MVIFNTMDANLSRSLTLPNWSTISSTAAICRQLDTIHTWESAPLKKIILKTDDDGQVYRAVEYIRDDVGDWVYSPVKETSSPQYYSERGEDCPPKMTTFDEFLSGDCGEEWCYLFTPNKGWQCWKLGWGDTNTQEYDFVTEEPSVEMATDLVTF